jgi:hypothetical protein
MTVLRTGIPAGRKEPMEEDALVRVNDAQSRDRVLREFNASTLDHVSPMKGDQQIKALWELNSPEDDQRGFE